ncbi:MAG: phytoene desaturase [Rhodothermales bacterium]|nr:phytoene desaturase [Rhodothermales bacterium]MBO6778599.1 phytoene desaturase [Rhodothermales bacterium]
MRERHEVIVIGAGFAGLAAATRLATLGRSVLVVEQLDSAGGRARKFEDGGFTFDMGPSWYWMPDVFEEYFRMAASDVNQHLDLVRLDPSYRTWFADAPVDIPAGADAVAELFDELEPGAGPRFQEFLAEAEHKYRIGMDRFVRQPGTSPLELMDPTVLPDVLKLTMFSSLAKHVRGYFQDPRIRQILEFPVLFLGARAENTPALYSMMNYADTALGTWYPMGGMHRIAESMVSVASNLGVEFRFGSAVDSVISEDGVASGVRVDGDVYSAAAVIAAADYHHVEQHLLEEKYRRYDEDYWDKRTMSPGSMIYYLGINRRLPGLRHHNLFFDAPFDPHAHTIYDEPGWPEDPLFYVCAPSVTDDSVAPDGCENLFILVPLAAGLDHDEQARERLFGQVMDRLENHLGLPVREHMVVRHDYAHREFERDYNAYKGNAYGLANTLWQTAFLKPKMKSKLPGLFFAGQLTTPGPGMPPTLISGQMAAELTDAWLIKHVPVTA